MSDFYSHHLKPARDLYAHFDTAQTGSGRPAGPRATQWSACLVLAYASLEAGLEDLLLAAHGHRLGRTGSATPKGWRRWIVEDRLQAPNAQRIGREVLVAFGVDLVTDPVVLPPNSFTIRSKRRALGGAGRGAPRPGPRRWTGIRPLLDALSFIRNATAHGDVGKKARRPESGGGSIWVPLVGGGWSVQLPHAASGLRCIVATFNYVALALDDAGYLGSDPLPLEAPDDVIQV